MTRAATDPDDGEPDDPVVRGATAAGQARRQPVVGHAGDTLPLWQELLLLLGIALVLAS